MSFHHKASIPNEIKPVGKRAIKSLLVLLNDTLVFKCLKKKPLCAWTERTLFK